MKLAEALSLRADLQQRFSQLKKRLKASTKIQEGDTPPENVEGLRLEMDEILEHLEDIIYRINFTNMNTVAGSGTLTELIARRDILTMRVSALREIADNMTEREDRFGRSEIRYVRTVDVSDLRKELDRYSKELRELDNTIQSLNWTVELQ